MTDLPGADWMQRKPKRASTYARRQETLRRRLAEMDDNINDLLRRSDMTILELQHALRLPKMYVEPAVLHMLAMGEVVEVKHGTKARFYRAAMTCKRGPVK